MTHASAIDLVACPVCTLVLHAGDGACPRCGIAVRRRRAPDLTRSWALLVAAAALYVPANVLTIVHIAKFPMRRSDTILSGILHLWATHARGLAVIVFVASVVVPLVKLASLAVLLVSVRARSSWRPRARARTYRVLEAAGHWSMLDVFVVALLTALVQLGRFANVEPGPAIIPFAGVVVLTMLASAAFDPRAIWDRGASD